MENETFATELLSEVRAQAKRWFMAFLIMVGLEVLTIVGFMWYISLPTDEDYVSLENETGNTNYVGADLYGDLNNGSDSSQKDTQGDAKQSDSKKNGDKQAAEH